MSYDLSEELFVGQGHSYVMQMPRFFCSKVFFWLSVKFSLFSSTGTDYQEHLVLNFAFFTF